ncbi:MAG TPA: MiaB/RimO family radical SAM methylthiotransferase [Polyangiaceae bacterium]|nr:MiaB/RimO family radical SAM methylthiotransferase [Polyangiaceae bacterium]
MPGFAVVTFGCQMNQHDSDRISEVLTRAGWTSEPDPERADLVLLNTCSVREKAEQKLRSEVGRIALIKERRPSLLIGIAGCVAQQEGERLAARMPDVDLVIGPDNIAELPGLLAEAELGAPAQVRTVFDTEEPRFLEARPEPGRAKPSEFVTVMKGCNERCAFCIVPHTRGPERYRPAREIIDEVARLVAAGAREVTLLGQTVNSYADPAGSLEPAPGAGERPWTHTHPTTARQDESQFPSLLHAIVRAVPGLVRLRYTSPHPRHLTRSLILAHRELAPLARHVHLPVQSGSDRMLRRMIRRYSAAEYRERVAALRAEVPGVTLSTDVIVGFPGETREDFAETLELVRDVGFTGLFGFKYSPRPYTPALKLDGEPSEDEKSARLAELFALSEAQRQAHLASLVGTRQDVLVEGAGRTSGYTGRSARNEIVHFECDADPTGHVVPVRVTRAFKNSLGAELDGAFVASAAGRAKHAARPERAERRVLPVAR